VELNLAISGEAVFGIGNKYVRLTPGNCLLQTMVDEHDTGCSLSEEFIYCCLHFYAGYVFYEFFQLNGTKYCSLGLGTLECPLRFCIRDELENIRTMPLPQEGKLHYLNLLLELLRLQLSIVEIQPKQFTHPQYRILAAARKIEASRGRECNAGIMARESGYSKFHFLRLFREETGKSFREYVNHVRCTAYRELVNQGFSKKNIADELGFSSAAALSHWSRRQKTLGTI
jgi:AraC-like DNA-binding protein